MISTDEVQCLKSVHIFTVPHNLVHMYINYSGILCSKITKVCPQCI